MFKTLSTKQAFTCNWYSVRRDDILLPNGDQGEYNVIEVPECAFVLPVTTDNNIVLIHSYRYTFGRYFWEIPAGALHPGQTPLEGAKQELREEIGGVTNDFQLLYSGATANGISNEIAHLFLARNVILGENALEPTEILTIHHVPIPEAIQLARSGKIDDLPSAMAILLAEPFLNGELRIANCEPN